MTIKLGAQLVIGVFRPSEDISRIHLAPVGLDLSQLSVDCKSVHFDRYWSALGIDLASPKPEAFLA